MADAITEEISQSNMSRPAKSAIRRWYEGMGGGAGIRRHVTEGAQAVRQGGESGLMGAALGLLEAERGSLDVQVGQHNVPIDGVVAGVGLLGSVMMANDATGLSADLRNLGKLGSFGSRVPKGWRLAPKGQGYSLGSKSASRTRRCARRRHRYGRPRASSVSGVWSGTIILRDFA